MLAVTLRLAGRFFRLAAPRVLATMAWRVGAGNLLALRRFRKRLKRGRVFPPFLFVSLTSRCNLRCRGCWVEVGAAPPGDIAPADMGAVIAGARRMGCRFFGLLGGEPLCHSRLWDILSAHRDSYFQLFTNGTLVDASVARRLRRLGNVTPLVSIEGDRAESDRRRGGAAVLDRSRKAVAACVEAGLVTGVATSLCRSNIDHMLTESFLDEMIDRGVLYVWYYLYRPVGGDPCPEEALGRDQVARIRKFLVEMRLRKPIMIVDSYWDHEGRALCPAAVGVSHHIGPWGDIEPCPPVQFAVENIADGDVARLVGDSAFLAAFRRTATETTRGCILLDDPAALRDLLERTGARATSRRDGLAEIRSMKRLPSHDLGADAIPEKHPLYRMAKKRWFFGFGAYG